MGILVHTCPHCLTDSVAMHVIGVRLHRGGDSGRIVSDCWGAVGAVCPKCGKPTCAILVAAAPFTVASQVDQAFQNLLSTSGDVENVGLKVKEIWPEPSKPNIPEHLPPSVERALLQAERNYPIDGNEEAAAMMYRRTLELTFKDRFPEAKGTLADRIKKLVNDKVLPEPMGDWADEIRLLGNGAAHDDAPVESHDLKMMRGLVEATLTYLYTLPKQISLRRAED